MRDEKVFFSLYILRITYKKKLHQAPMSKRLYTIFCVLGEEKKTKEFLISCNSSFKFVVRDNEAGAM